MTAIISSNTNKAAVTAHPEAAKTKVESSKPKATAPVQAAEVLNKTPANKSNTSPAAVVALGNSKTLEQNLYTKTGGLEKPSSSPKIQKSAAKDETPDSGDSFVAGKGDVIVDIKNSDSGYDNKIFWSTDNFKTKHYIGVDNNTDSVNIGKFAEGTKIDFGIENGEGQFFRTGEASSNSDNIKHATVTKTAEGSQYGFEDLNGGGDNDFNDAIFSVRNAEVPADNKVNSNPKPAPEVKTNPDTKVTPDVKETKDSKNQQDVNVQLPPKPEPKNEGKKVEPKVDLKNKVDIEVLPKTSTKDDTKAVTDNKKTEEKLKPITDDKTKVDNNVTRITPRVEVKTDSKNSTNRSGLGDGTNPGQGDGRVNSPNTGTNNPGKLAAYSAKPATGSQLKVAV